MKNNACTINVWNTKLNWGKMSNFLLFYLLQFLTNQPAWNDNTKCIKISIRSRKTSGDNCFITSLTWTSLHMEPACNYHSHTGNVYSNIPASHSDRGTTFIRAVAKARTAVQLWGYVSRGAATSKQNIPHQVKSELCPTQDLRDVLVQSHGISYEIMCKHLQERLPTYIKT